MVLTYKNNFVMFIDNIKRSRPLILFFIILIIAFFWLNPFNSYLATSVNCSNSFMPLNIMFLKLFPISSFSNKFISITLFIVLSLLISQFNFKYAIIPELTYMPSIIFVIISLSFSNVKDCSYISIIGILMLLIFELLINTYKKENLSYNILNASIILGLSSLFYFNALFYIVFLVACLLTLRPFFWREWIFLILGIIINYYFFFTIGYLGNYDFLAFFQNINNIFHTHIHISFTFLQKIQFFIFCISTLIASFFLLVRLGSFKILVRKIHNLLFLLFLNSVAIIILIPYSGNEIFVMVSMASSLLISNYFIYSKQKKIKSIIFLLMIIVFFSIQFEKFIPPGLVEFFRF